MTKAKEIVDGYCECGPNDLRAGKTCAVCGYAVPTEKEYGRNWLFFFAISTIIGGFVFFTTPPEWRLSARIVAAVVALLLSFGFIRTGMGPYLDGVARWDAPGDDSGEM